MYPILIAAIAVWLTATGYSTRLRGRVGNRRVGLLTLALACMAFREAGILFSASIGVPLLAAPSIVGPSSLLVASVALLAVFSLDRVLVDEERTRRDLRDRESVYRGLAELSPAGIFRGDPSGRCVFMNERWRDMTGQCPEEAIGLGWMKRVHPDDRQHTVDVFKIGKREGRSPIRCEFRLLRPDGGPTWAMWQVMETRAESGAVTGYIGTITDIGELKRVEEQLEEARNQLQARVEERTAHLVTANRALEAENAERKRVEQTLRESEGMLRAILDNTTAIVYVKDLSGRYVLVNERFAERTRLTRMEIEGKTDHDLFAQEIADAFRVNDLKVLEVDGPLEFDEIRNHAGQDYHCISTKVALRDPSGVPYALCGISTEVTERVRAQRERDRIFNLSRDLMCTAGFDGRLAECNPAFEPTLGYRPEELRALDFSELLHPDDLENAMAAAGRVRAGAPLEDFEVRWRCRDGSYKWISWTVVAFIAEHRTYAVGRDVTARKLADESIRRHQEALERENTRRREAEDRLRESEERLQAILDNTPAVVHVKDLEGRYQLVNRRFEELVRVTREEACGKTAFDILPLEAAEAFHANELKVLETNQALQFEETMVRDDGPHHYISTRFPLPDSSGAPIAISCIATDVTELMRARQERDRCFDLSLDMMCMGDVDGYLTVCNPAFASVLGYQLEEVPGMHFSEFIHPEDRERGLAEFDKLRHGVPIEDFEIRWRCKDGSEKWLWWKVVPVLAEGKMYAVARDITTKKYAEETMRKHREQIAHVLRVHTMGELASQIAHELNQPLSAIASYANGAVMRLEAGGAHTEIVAVIRKIAEQALEAGSLIHRIREFATKGGLQLERVDLNKLVEAAAALLKPGTEQGVELRLELAPSLPEIEMDAAQIEQVIVNLMRNGVESMEVGGEGNRLLSIETSRTDPDHVEFAVRDAGIGLPPGRLDHMFEPFFTTKPSGLGMGLAISRTIMEAHGGRLWAGRNPDGGATFRGVLPIRQTSS